MSTRFKLRFGAAGAVAIATALAASTALAESPMTGAMSPFATAIDGTKVSAVDKTQKKDAKAATAKAKDQRPTAREKAKPVSQQAQTSKGKKKPADEPAAEILELRSDTQERTLFSSLFGGTPQMLPETQRRDAALKEREARGKKFTVKEEFVPRVVEYPSAYARGTIVVNTSEKRLYLIESSTKARRYAIAVGRDGLKFKGTGQIKDKQEWPRWIPTKEMQQREPKKYGQYKDGMPGGPDNPLGARAMYLYQGGKDTYIRVHGTNQPWSIGTDSSNGCFRMINEHVMDLYDRVRTGAQMVVL